MKSFSTRGWCVSGLHDVATTFWHRAEAQGGQSGPWIDYQEFPETINLLAATLGPFPFPFFHQPPLLRGQVSVAWAQTDPEALSEPAVKRARLLAPIRNHYRDRKRPRSRREMACPGINLTSGGCVDCREGAGNRLPMDVILGSGIGSSGSSRSLHEVVQSRQTTPTRALNVDLSCEGLSMR